MPAYEIMLDPRAVIFEPPEVVTVHLPTETMRFIHETPYDARMLCGAIRECVSILDVPADRHNVHQTLKLIGAFGDDDHDMPEKGS